MPESHKLEIVHSYNHDARPGTLKVTLERNSKGYRWELSYEGENSNEVLAKLKEVDAELRREYGD